MTHRGARTPITRCLAGLLLVLTTTWCVAAPVLMVSVDGMKPEYVLDAQHHGLQLPYLRSVLAQGAHAEGVIGVWPTITYPSHTTLVTGVAPAEHGIYNNPEFDPLHRLQDPWYWYASQVRVTTLWQAVHAAHGVTASIGWPVTVGADIDYLIPEYWRIMGRAEELAPSDRQLIAALARPAGLIEALAPAAGPYMMANDTSLAGDAIKARYAIEVLRRHHPQFMTVHLSSLDDAEHSFGPFSTEANADMEALDAMLGELAAAARRVNPSTTVVIVSDHGFIAVPQRLNLAVPFVQAGLMTLDEASPGEAPRLRDWKAQPWFAGGMAAIMLKDPADRATADQVGALLRTLAKDPANGIAGVYDAAAMHERGGFPDAAYVVDFLPGYYAGSNVSGPLVTPMPPGHGGHGFSPDLPDMRSAFFAVGPHVAAGRDLGVIDMRQIAPTVALLLGVRLPDSRAATLSLQAAARQ